MSETDYELTNKDVEIKYRKAAEFANQAARTVLEACQAGASVKALCELGDNTINRLCDNVFKKAKPAILKGVAFPTCVSVNHVVSHFSPLEGEDMTLQEGDYVKIDLGCHLDGYIATVAHTASVGADAMTPIVGRDANVLVAAQTALQAALRCMKPGCTNTQVTEAMGKVANTYGVQLCEGVLSHQLQKDVIDGMKVIISKPDVDQKVDEFTFEPYQAYALDVIMTSGTGHTRPSEARTTVFSTQC